MAAVFPRGVLSKSDAGAAVSGSAADAGGAGVMPLPAFQKPENQLEPADGALSLSFLSLTDASATEGAVLVFSSCCARPVLFWRRAEEVLLPRRRTVTIGLPFDSRVLFESLFDLLMSTSLFGCGVTIRVSLYPACSSRSCRLSKWGASDRSSKTRCSSPPRAVLAGTSDRFESLTPCVLGRRGKALCGAS